MKKILSIALVALLAVSSVFAADFSGSASINFGYDFGTKAWGFENENSTKIDIKASIASGSVDKAGEGEIYAGIKAAFAVDYKIANSGVTASVSKNAISEAYITNGEWKVSILKAAAGSDFATSKAIDGSKAVSYKLAVAAAPGVTVSYDGYTIGLGLAGVAKTVDWSAYVATPEYAVAEGLKVKAAASAADGGNIAASASVAYKGESSASAAADFGINAKTKAYGFDVAASASYDVVAVDAYYNYAAKSLKAQAVATIDDYKVTVVGKDLLGAKTLTAKVSGKIEDVSFTVSGGYTLASKAWNAAAEASYDIFKASVDVAAKSVKVKASATSSDVIPGATVALAYASGNLVAKEYGAVDATCTIKF